MKYDGRVGGRAEGGRQAANARTNQGLIYAQMVNYADVPRGDRVKLYNAMRRANAELAIQLQDLVAEKLEQGRVDSRRGVSSGRLEKAIKDRRNRTSNAFYMGVGVRSWMDKSDAKYWRAIEVGTSQFVGNTFQPFWLWGSSLTSGEGNSKRYGPYPLAGPAFTGSAEGRGGRLRPMGRSYAYRLLIAHGATPKAAFAIAGGPKSKRQPIVIRRPIAAQRYYRRAWTEFDGFAKGQAALLAAMREAGITGKAR